MLNLFSWRTWLVLAVTLMVVTWALYLLYVVDTMASKQASLSQPTPKLDVGNTEEQCFQRIQDPIPFLLNHPALVKGISTMDFQDHLVPVLITPTRYAVLNLETYQSLVQESVTKNFPSCIKEVGGYTITNLQVQTPLDAQGPLVINLRYKVRWENKILKEGRAALMVYLNPKHIFEFVNSYVEIQRTTPALRLSDLEALAQKHGVSVELYGFGDTVAMKLQDLQTASTLGHSAPSHALYFAMQFP